MSTRYLIMLAACTVMAGNAWAEDGEVLAERNNCLLCHTISGEPTGSAPAFKDVAAKYRNNKNAQALLEKKVRNGGSGSWGKVPMPATAKSLSDGDIHNLVKWVLSIR